MRQAVDRDHQNVVLDAVDAPRTDETHDTEGAVACEQLLSGTERDD
jgi:hypothetical protein